MLPDRLQAPSFSNRRTTERYLVSWRADVEIPGGEIHSGVTCDLSLDGAAILLDKNILDAPLLRVHLAIPPVEGLLAGDGAVILAERRYTILDSRHQRFRVGLRFREYHAGLRALADRLEHSMACAGGRGDWELEAGGRLPGMR